MKTEVINLTPKIAKELIAKNTKNRKLNEEKVREYAAYMSSGNWKLSHQGIAISETGTVLDGQHRLMAVIKSETTVPMMKVTGLPDDTMTVIDIGKKRSLADAFNLLEVPCAANISSIINRYCAALAESSNIFGRESGARSQFASNFLTAQEKYDLYLENETLITKTLALAQKCYQHVKFYKISEIGGISFYLIKDKGYTFSKVSSFWLNVHMIGDDPSIPACKALSNILLKYIGGSEKMKATYKSAITIKAWNHYVAATPVKVLKFSDQEDFPKFS